MCGPAQPRKVHAPDNANSQGVLPLWAGDSDSPDHRQGGTDNSARQCSSAGQGRAGHGGIDNQLQKTWHLLMRQVRPPPPAPGSGPVCTHFCVTQMCAVQPNCQDLRPRRWTISQGVLPQGVGNSDSPNRTLGGTDNKVKETRCTGQSRSLRHRDGKKITPTVVKVDRCHLPHIHHFAPPLFSTDLCSPPAASSARWPPETPVGVRLSLAWPRLCRPT